MNRALVPSEYEEAITLVEFCKAKKIRLVSIPNGFSTTAREGSRQKKLGLCVGFPDYFLPYARFGLHGLFIELKRKCGSYAGVNQQAWLDYLNSAGYRALICKGSDHAIREIEEYLNETAI